MYGVIDIGSNTIRLSIYKVIDNEIKLFLNKKNIAGLAGYVNKQHCLSSKGIQKAINVLNEYKQILENVEIKHVFVFATASLRNIQNTEQATNIIQEETGLDIQVLTGNEEAEFDYYGAVQSVTINNGLLVDIGGGSTELVFFNNKEIVAALSMPIGSLNLFSRYVSEIIPDSKEMKQIQNAVLEELEKIELPDYEVDTRTICGVGGTARATCKLNNDVFKMSSSNRVFEQEDLTKLINMLDKQNKKMVHKILQVIPERIHTIIPGMIILKTIATFYNSSSVTVSTYGVREGYLYYSLQQRGELYAK